PGPGGSARGWWSGSMRGPGASRGEAPRRDEPGPRDRYDHARAARILTPDAALGLERRAVGEDRVAVKGQSIAPDCNRSGRADRREPRLTRPTPGVPIGGSGPVADPSRGLGA